jgi:hypothetical protein
MSDTVARNLDLPPTTSISIVGELAKNYKGRPAANGLRCAALRRALVKLRGLKRPCASSDRPLAGFAARGSVAACWNSQGRSGVSEERPCNMRRDPVRHERGYPPETEAWKIIFGAFALSGLLVTGWTLFVWLTDTPRAPRPGDQAAQTTGTQDAPKP